MRLTELMKDGIPETNIPAFKNLSALEIFNRVDDVLGYFHRRSGELKDSAIDLEAMQDLSETLYSVALAVRDAYVKGIKTPNVEIFNRVKIELLDIHNRVLNKDYEKKIGEIIAGLEWHQERKAINYSKYVFRTKNRFKLR